MEIGDRGGNICCAVVIHGNECNSEACISVIFIHEEGSVNAGVGEVITAECLELILWHVDPLLGNNHERSGYTTAVAKQWL
jgi:hypothetical protein